VIAINACWNGDVQQSRAIDNFAFSGRVEYRELLLGFEPLDGPHSGVNLSEVLMEIFKNHDITNRVLAITSDNASNNTTLETVLSAVSFWGSALTDPSSSRRLS
jgi:hypothetical protein